VDPKLRHEFPILRVGISLLINCNLNDRYINTCDIHVSFVPLFRNYQLNTKTDWKIASLLKFTLR